MKLLLHICCAPCMIFPLDRLREKGFQVCGLFYNPNIHPFCEYNRRRSSVEELSSREGLEVIYPEYLPRQFFQAVNLMEERIQRCPICWFQRLEETAEIAKKNGFDCFSTTLLVSPYQDQEALKKMGGDVSKTMGVNFYYEDFRSGFKKAHDEAKVLGLYCQRYCGCIYSELEKCRKSERL